MSNHCAARSDEQSLRLVASGAFGPAIAEARERAAVYREAMEHNLDGVARDVADFVEERLPSLPRRSARLRDLMTQYAAAKKALRNAGRLRG